MVNNLCIDRLSVVDELGLPAPFWLKNSKKSFKKRRFL